VLPSPERRVALATLQRTNEELKPIVEPRAKAFLGLSQAIRQHAALKEGDDLRSMAT